MRFSTLACLVALVIPQATATQSTAPQSGSSPTLTQKDRDAAVKYLEETRKNFLASIDGLSDAQWTFKAGPDRWSIAETAEHIAVSEGVIMQLITEKILKGPKAPAGAARPPDEKIITVITDRSAKAQAPEMLQPKSRFATRDALTKDFVASRQKTIEFVKTTPEDLRAFIAPHPAMKEIDAYQWVLLTAAHSARHTAQIDEVKTAPDYPKK
jgi:uncharacterized damage-inducible protein DinB